MWTEIIIVVTVVATSMLSGVFGMAGGMLLMALLVAVKPVAAAMIIHGIVQGTSNGARALILRRHIAFGILPWYLLGAALALGTFVTLTLVPDAALVLIVIGVFPFLARLLPKQYGLDVTRPATSVVCGTAVTAAQLFAGASGPLLDVFYLHARLDRYQIIANKALTQTIGHMLKLIYYGGVIGVAGDGIEPATLALAVPAAILGTRLGTRLLDYMGDAHFRRMSGWVILAIGAACIVQGVRALLS